MIFFIGTVHLLLLGYCLQIKIGKHKVSFSHFLMCQSIVMLVACGLDYFKILDIPKIIELVLCLGVIHALFWMTYLHFYAKRKHPVTPDVIFVFGAGLIENRLSLSLKTRLDKAYELAVLYPHCPMIVSGGQGKKEWLSEAEAMSNYLVSKGICLDRIILEDQSTTTWENLKFSMQRYDLRHKKIALISNQFHVYRIEAMAKKLGLDGYGVPAYLQNISTLAFYIREYYACIKAFIKQEI